MIGIIHIYIFIYFDVLNELVFSCFRSIFNYFHFILIICVGKILKGWFEEYFKCKDSKEKEVNCCKEVQEAQARVIRPCDTAPFLLG